MATIVDVTGTAYPSSFGGHAVEPLEGESLLPVFGRDATGDDRKPMFWEHEGNAAVRIGKWKLVSATRARGSSTTWRPTAPSCNDLASRSIPSA